MIREPIVSPVPRMLAEQPNLTDDLLADERWQLVHRITSSPPFQKSTRLRDLLEYITERTLHGHSQELTEQHIGNALFHKPSGYSSLEDSSVRVHARQLRLKLHEYFDEEGRSEPLILSIPKGSYAPVFKPRLEAVPSPESQAKTPPALPWYRRIVWAWVLCGVLAAACAGLIYQSARRNSAAGLPANPPWPFSQLFDTRHQTVIVVADSNYGMSRILASQPGSLDQYLRREFLQSPPAHRAPGADSRLSEYISNSELTSFADVADVVTLLGMAGPLQKRASVRYPRDLGIRDLDHDNYIFIGSPGSNPWVSLFQSKLNFKESESVVGNSVKSFVNLNPLAGVVWVRAWAPDPV